MNNSDNASKGKQRNEKHKSKAGAISKILHSNTIILVTAFNVNGLNKLKIVIFRLDLKTNKTQAHSMLSIRNLIET